MRQLFPNCIDAEAKAEKRRQRANLWNKGNPVRKKQNYVSYMTKLKRVVIDAYGGKCECCSEDNIGFLTIDHINNDGGKERKLLGSGQTFYVRLKKLGFPKDKYRVLCMNCNWGRRITGICPHMTPRIGLSLFLPVSNNDVKSVDTLVKT